MVQILFHGPNDDNGCRREVRKLARELGGKFHYTSFWCGRKREWFSKETFGRAAYSVRVEDSKIGTRDNLAKLVRRIRRDGSLVVHGLTFIRADHHHFEGPLAKPGYREAWDRVHHYFWED